MIKAVVDTNILISALITKRLSSPSQVYNFIKSENFLLVTSSTILEELEDVISREEIVKLHQKTPKQIKEILKEIVETSYIVPGLVSVEVVKEDPDDDKFLAAAIEGRADYVVSGDKPLLNIKEYHGIKIVSPTDFINLLEKSVLGELQKT